MSENGEEVSEEPLVDELDDLKSLGELKIEDDAEEVFEDGTGKGDAASLHSHSSNLESSQRSSLPSLSGILSSFSGRGKEKSAWRTP